jgi:PKHD-type hydroxylase
MQGGYMSAAKYFTVKKLYNSDEIKEINKAVENVPQRGTDIPAVGVTKTSTVKRFALGDIPLLQKFANVSEEINQHKFGFNIYPLQFSDGLNHNTYKADKNSEYFWHMDGTFSDSVSDIKITCLLNLSENPYEGGEFCLLSMAPDIKEEFSKVGTAIFFPAFFIHRVTPVTKGERISLTLWRSGPRFQ